MNVSQWVLGALVWLCASGSLAYMATTKNQKAAKAEKGFMARIKRIIAKVQSWTEIPEE